MYLNAIKFSLVLQAFFAPFIYLRINLDIYPYIAYFYLFLLYLSLNEQ
ncbi:hypothetical protein HMPREF9382_1498 [Streptococcus sanguinis SK115]|uniref:Uncharacterized protein n=1 Tax=Streptococcus sanguinis SK115 TaxID=888810 RepID=F0I9L4_STRSA|nr:hypothetical protein HMPREF9382_1498 [Streptococcus sanguinis SK115]